MKWVYWTFMTASFFLLQGFNLPFYHRWTLHHEHHPSVHTQSLCMLWGQQFALQTSHHGHCEQQEMGNTLRYYCHYDQQLYVVRMKLDLGSLRGIVWTSKLRLGSGTDRVGSSSITGEASCTWFSLQSLLLYFLLRPACRSWSHIMALPGPKEGHRKSSSCLLGWPLSTVNGKSLLHVATIVRQRDPSLHFM